VEKLYQNYKDRAEFLLVYIREAHPDSVLYTQRDGTQTLLKIIQTETLAERTETARMCVETLRLSCPTVIDRDDNAVNMAYAAWPDRFAVVGVDGRIAYLGEQGPKGFKLEEVEQWLEENTK
jgi:hypothetical protein